MNQFQVIYEKNKKDIGYIREIIHSVMNSLSVDDFMSLMDDRFDLAKITCECIQKKIKKKNMSLSCQFLSGSGNIRSHGRIRYVISHEKDYGDFSLTFNVNYNRNITFSQFNFTRVDLNTRNIWLELVLRQDSFCFCIPNSNSGFDSYTYNYLSDFYKKESMPLPKSLTPVKVETETYKVKELKFNLDLCFTTNPCLKDFLHVLLIEHLLNNSEINNEVKDLFLLKYDSTISDYRSLITIDLNSNLKIINTSNAVLNIKKAFNKIFK